MTQPTKTRSQVWTKGNRGYFVVLFVIIVAFVGIAAAMQVLVLVSVGTTSRAYDTYRQGSAEMVRLERAVGETMLQFRQVSVAAAPQSVAGTLHTQLQNINGGGAAITATLVPSSLPTVAMFPNAAVAPDPLEVVPDDLVPYLTPELSALIGPRVVPYPEVTFEFSSEREVLEVNRSFSTQVTARYIAVPLSRFPVAAYDFPAELGSAALPATSAPASAAPAGLVPSRDAAFAPELQSQPGVLPYHYRRRALLAAAYRYVFSQQYIDRVAEYAGITHYHDMDAFGATADLAGMSVVGSVTSWDLGVAGEGTYTTITMTKDAAVIFTQEAGKTLRLYDSVGAVNTPLLILALGPSDASVGQLTLDLSTIVRPVVIVGYNVRVTTAAGTGVNGALMIDPASTMAPTGSLSIGHFSYWAGSTTVPADSVTSTGMSRAAESLAPRVVYVATKARRL